MWREAIARSREQRQGHEACYRMQFPLPDTTSSLLNAVGAHIFKGHRFSVWESGSPLQACKDCLLCKWEGSVRLIRDRAEAVWCAMKGKEEMGPYGIFALLLFVRCYLCVYVCMCVPCAYARVHACVHVCIHVHACVHCVHCADACIFMYVCMCVHVPCACICMCACACRYVHAYTCMHACMHICTCTCTCVFAACVHVCTCVYAVYTCVFVCICIRVVPMCRGQ